MNIAFYNGISGLMAFQQNINTTANNIANVNTSGFKASRTAFEDLLYTRINTSNGGEKYTGHGSYASSEQLMFEQSGLTQTERMLDFALIGDGFFAVRAQDGSTQFSRNGNFGVSIQGKKSYLVTNDGKYVLDEKYKPIELTKSESGTYKFDDLPQRLGVFTVANPYGLVPVGNGSYAATETTGKITANSKVTGEPVKVIQSALESSSVDMATEMVNAMQSQRAYQFSAKIVQTADQLEEIINTLR